MTNEAKETTVAEPVAIDRAYLEANHPDVVSAIQEETAAAERARIAAIDENTIPGHEALAQKAKADGTEPGAFALQMVGAEREARKGAAESIEKDAPKPVKIDTDAVEPAPEKKVVAKDATPEEKADAAWENEDPNLKAKFIGGKEAYIRGFIAEEKGQVKVLGK